MKMEKVLQGEREFMPDTKLMVMDKIAIPV